LTEKQYTGQFHYEVTEAEPRPSLLYQRHLRLTKRSRMANFAGYIMPLWYSTPSKEHQAVRRAAGIFDCTHMAVLEVAGPGSTEFLHAVTSNDIKKLIDGKAQYSFVFDAAGNILDDIIVYRRGDEQYMLVVNAANESKIKAYFNALQNRRVVIDTETPEKQLEHQPRIRDMKDTFAGKDCRVDIAVQGPTTNAILCRLSDDLQIREKINSLTAFRFFETELDGINCIISRTGYSGSSTGVEVFVHPEKAVKLWDALMEAGKNFGLEPCGLASRDSLRIEAGLPLYGHELNGKHDISPFEAGYGWAVKLRKRFFIGKNQIKKRKNYKMQIVRLQTVSGKGTRPVRADDAVLNSKGECIGWITSAAAVDSDGFAQAYIDKKYAEEKKHLGIYYLARSKRQVEQGKKTSADLGDKLESETHGTIVSRSAKF